MYNEIMDKKIILRKLLDRMLDAIIESNKINLKYILNTHHHYDHIGLLILIISAAVAETRRFITKPLLGFAKLFLLQLFT